MAEIILDHVTKRFPDGALAVDDFNLDIADGEFMVLVGPSGCGKSTVLNMIAGLEDISEGELRIGGQVVNDRAPKDRDIAMVFQSYALYPHMTVRENMGFALKLAKTPQNVINEKVEEAARILDLTQHLDRRPANLSGGQRQRVAMGRAIVRDPSAFLMDEPLSNLDAKLRVQTRTEVSRLQRRLGTTMVYVTHDQVEAMTLGDRVAVMRSGVLQQVASPRELYERPVNLFVAGFIGSPAMNFMSGVLEEGKLRTALGDFPVSGQLQQDLAGSNVGRDVIVGIRSENFEDGALVPAENRHNGITFPATIDVVESLGSEIFVYFSKELGAVETAELAELAELARDSGRADGGTSAETVVARLDPATRITEGQTAELWVDVRAIHVFDPQTGRNLTSGEADILETSLSESAFAATAGRSQAENHDPLVSPAPAAPTAGLGSSGEDSPPPPPPGDGPSGEGIPALPPSAYARLDCPGVVQTSVSFLLEVGLAGKPSPELFASELKLPPGITTRYQLSVHVIADGFSLDQGERWRREIEVTGQDPYPIFEYHLIPEPQEEPQRPRLIRATYAANGQTMGFAVRPVVVVSTANLTSITAPDPRPSKAVAVPTDSSAPDLTIHITRSDTPGQLLWTVETPHAEIDIWDEPAECEIGAEPFLFTQQLVDGVRVQDARVGIYELLVGKGTRITDKIPRTVRDTLRQVCDVVTHTPTILFLSEEPYVPWELAAFDDPPLRETGSPFLAAQLDVGRWILADERPKSPPPDKKHVHSFMVMHNPNGDQDGWGRLEFAEQEAAELQDLYNAVPIEARVNDLRQYLRGRTRADVMHFAMHGNYDRDGVENGLILIDGWVLTPDMVRAYKLNNAPFVFLNSCQVGRGDELLGDYAGMAEAFLYAGASAVVAPIWNVNDAVAQSVALNFYAQVTQGRTPSEIFREERARFVDEDNEEGSSATHLAYLFFGHPRLQFARPAGDSASGSV